MGEAVVLNEIAWIPREGGRVCLYIRHPSRLHGVMRDRQATGRLPPTVMGALDIARQRYDTWNREMESLFDAHWRELLEPPYRLLLGADGRLEQLDELVGVTWTHLQAILGSDRRPVLKQRSAGTNAAAESHQDAALRTVLLKHITPSS